MARLITSFGIVADVEPTPSVNCIDDGTGVTNCGGAPVYETPTMVKPTVQPVIPMIIGASLMIAAIVIIILTVNDKKKKK